VRDDVLEEVATVLMDKITREWEDPGRYREEWLESLRRALEDDDAWKICRSLEDDGWDVDEDLMDIMRGAWIVVADALNAALEAWVIDAQVTLALPVGTDVEVDVPRHGRLCGTVVSLDPTRGTYTVRFPSLGHVESGPGTRGRVFPAEMLTGGIV
jgi:hypothetical protein